MESPGIQLVKKRPGMSLLVKCILGILILFVSYQLYNYFSVPKIENLHYELTTRSSLSCHIPLGDDPCTTDYYYTTHGTQSDIINTIEQSLKKQNYSIDEPVDPNLVIGVDDIVIAAYDRNHQKTLYASILNIYTKDDTHQPKLSGCRPENNCYVVMVFKVKTD